MKKGRRHAALMVALVVVVIVVATAFITRALNRIGDDFSTEFQETFRHADNLIIDAVKFQVALRDFALRPEQPQFDDLLAKLDLLFLRADVVANAADRLSLDSAPFKDDLIISLEHLESLLADSTAIHGHRAALFVSADRLESLCRRAAQYFETQAQRSLAATHRELTLHIYRIVAFLCAGALLAILLIISLFQQRDIAVLLRQSEANLRRIIDVMPTRISVRDRDGRLLLLNRACADDLATTVHGSTGKLLQDIHPDPETSRQMHADDLQVMSSGRAVWNSESRTTAKDGSTAWRDSTRIPFTHKQGDAPLLLCLDNDITSVKESEAERLKLRNMLINIINSMPSVLIAVDAACVVTRWNTRAARSSGISAREAIGQEVQSVYPNIARYRKLLEKALHQGTVQHSYKYPRVVGEQTVYEDITVFPLINDAVVGGAVIRIDDITEQVRRDERLAQSDKIMSVGVLAGGIAHDFNNILVAILGNLNLGLQYLPEGHRVRSLLQSAETASLRAKDLTQQLLTFSRGGEPIRHAAGLEDLIQDSCGFVLSGSGIQCVYDVPADLWPAHIDSGQISQVLQNLTLNAKDALGGQGRIVVSAQNVDGLSGKPPDGLPLGRYVQIRVEDDGCGIAPELCSRIFDPYFTTKNEGNGLGLAVCHSIIAKHDGSITVESVPGTGTVFTLHLPAASEEIRAEQAGAEAAEGGRGTVLIMDDEQSVRTITGQMLEYLGYDTLSASSGEEAIAAYTAAMEEGRTIDVLIMDLTIPGAMGGKEAVRKILEINPRAKAVVASGYSNDPVMANHAAYGFSAALSKPFVVEDLARAIRRLLPRAGS